MARRAPQRGQRLDERVRGWWSAQAPANRLGALGGAAILLLVFVGVGALVASTASGSSNGREGGASATASQPPLEFSNVPGSRDAADSEAESARTSTPGVITVRNLADFTKRYGEPPGSGMARLRIPSLSVNATVGARLVGDDGVMTVPAGPADVVWYDLSEFGLGGRPGGGQNAVFSGHVDYADVVPYAEVRYQGIGVFYSLDKLSPGDIIELDVSGQTLRYAVDWRRQVTASESNWNELFSASVERDSITLITCSGDFDLSSRSYASRTVVRAVRL